MSVVGLLWVAKIAVEESSIAILEILEWLFDLLLTSNIMIL